MRKLFGGVYEHLFGDRGLSLLTCLVSETVDRSALAFQGVHDVKRGHGLSSSVLAVGDGVTDNVAEEGFEDGAGLVVHQSRDALHATTASQPTDGGLRDALDVVAHDLAMTLGAALAKALATLSTAGHVGRLLKVRLPLQ